MKIGKSNSYLHSLLRGIYDPVYKGEYKPKFHFWSIRLTMLAFLILYFHLINKYPLMTLGAINVAELSYLIYSIVLFSFFRHKLSAETQIYKLIFDFLFITFFMYLSLSKFGYFSWLFVLYLVPVVHCSFWFNWIFTLIFTTSVSALYSFLSYPYLDKFEDFYRLTGNLGPIVVVFYVAALGVNRYKKKIQTYYEKIEREVQLRTAELIREKEYTLKLLKSSFDAIVVFDKDGYVTKVNERTCELFEYNKEEMVKKKVTDFYASGEGHRIMKELRNSVDGSIENFDAYILSKRKEEIPILLSAAFLYDKSLDLEKELSKGRKFATVSYFRDKRAENAIDDIAKEITSTTNERELFTKIAEIVAKILKAEACSILTYNEGRGLFKVITSYGMPERLKRTEIFESYDEKDSMTSKIFSSKQTLNISNIDVHKEQPRDIKIKWEYAQNFAKYSRFGDYKHFLGTPLLVQGEVYGVIRVLNKYSNDRELDKQGFTEKDIKLLERISKQVSILVEKVRDKGRFRAISEVGRNLNQMLYVPLDDLLETIAKEVVKGMRFKACALRLIEEGDILKIKACYGLKGKYTNNEKYNLKIGECISGVVAKTGDTRIIEDLKNEEDFEFKDILEKEELRSMLSVPLKYRNRVIGLINCYTRRIHKFTEQEIQTMNTFADYASTAIQNKKRVEELVYALNEIGNELVKPIKIEELFDLILKKAKELSGADRLCIKNYVERNGKMETVRALNCKWHEQHKDYLTDVMKGVGVDIFGEAVHKGKSLIFSDYDKLRGKLKRVPDKEIFDNLKSIAFVPIKIENKVYGLLILESFRENFFKEDDLLVLETFSNQAAIALRNANLFDKLYRVTETFPGISELDTDIDKVLHNIVNIAAEVLETDILLLYRWDAARKKIIWPPIYNGDIKYAEYMKSEVGSSDLPMHLIKKGKSHYAEYSQNDPIMTLGGKPPNEGIPARFVFRESIVSCAGILLKVGQETVGVLLINYRTYHKFDEDERKIIENYAFYIAVAIQNVIHFSEKQAASAMQTLGQLAAAIAHKIKNDIGTINLYAGDLIDDTPPESPSYSSLAQIKDKVRKIATDINNLLVASKRKTPEKKFIDIKNLINEIEQDIQSDLKAKNVEFEKKIIANIPKIKVDPAQIKMVLSNLADNSIEAMPKGGKISISISELEHVVLIDWKDTGKGISPENAEKIFHPFWTMKNKGFGLGLFLSKTIIEQHGGSISFDSTYTKGAKFIIKFPVKEQD